MRTWRGRPNPRGQALGISKVAGLPSMAAALATRPAAELRAWHGSDHPPTLRRPGPASVHGRDVDTDDKMHYHVCMVGTQSEGTEVRAMDEQRRECPWCDGEGVAWDNGPTCEECEGTGEFTRWRHTDDGRPVRMGV
jgi:hypothetical protein